MKPIANAMNGENISPYNMSVKPDALIAANPADATTAPAKEPINACDDEDGIPSHHVIKFQVIAARSAAITTCSPCSSVAGSATCPPIVFATPVNVSAPTKLSEDARIIALLGVNARVDTEVAIALAVS